MKILDFTCPTDVVQAGISDLPAGRQVLDWIETISDKTR
jgi:hypothetical protein